MGDRGNRHRGREAAPVVIEWDPEAEVRCVHVQECGACPMMPRKYDDQRAAKAERMHKALARYDLTPTGGYGDVDRASAIAGYRRRAKLVVARDPGTHDVSVGLYRRHDNQNVVDIPHCQVLSPGLIELVAEIRELVNDPPPELGCLMTVSSGEEGVLTSIDARELCLPDDDEHGSDTAVLLTLLLTAERAKPVEEMREAARALRQRLPQIAGLAVSLRYSSRSQSSSEFIALSGVSESKDVVGRGYQLVSHTSFLHVHRGQAERLYRLVEEVVTRAVGDGSDKPGKILDLYGGTGAIALTLARLGHHATLVESYPPAAALASRAAQAQRLNVEVVTGDVASVTLLDVTARHQAAAHGQIAFRCGGGQPSATRAVARGTREHRRNAARPSGLRRLRPLQPEP